MITDKTLVQEFTLARHELNLERKAAILYGVGKNPADLNPDLLDFSVEVLGTTLGYEYDTLARKIVRWQNDTIREAGWYRSGNILAGSASDDLILAYRGGGKSTWGTIVRSIWYLVRDPDLRIGLTSETEELPKAFMREIGGHMVSNVDLREMFGEFRGQGRVWDSKAIVIAQRRKIHLKEPSLHAFGVGGQSAGWHYDVKIADDLVTFKGSRTLVVRKSLSDWYDSTYGGLDMRHTISHHLGTPYFPGDLYDRLENGRKDEGEKTGSLQAQTMKIPAEYVAIENDVPVRRATSPTRLPLEYLDKKRIKIGRIHYGTQYMMDRSLMVGSVFSLSDFNWYDPDDPNLRMLRQGWARYCYFDLKATSKSIGDFFCGVVVAVAPDKSRVDVVDLVREHWGMSKQRRAIINLTRRHQATLSGIEAVQMQTAFAEEIQESELIPCEPVKVETDKVARAMSVSPQVEAHKVWLPMSDPNAEHEHPLCVRMRPFLEELVQFPNGDHDDTVDAFVGAMKLAFYGGAAAAGDGTEEDARPRGRASDRARERMERRKEARAARR